MLKPLSDEVKEEILESIRNCITSCIAIQGVLEGSDLSFREVLDYLDSYTLHSQARVNVGGFNDICIPTWTRMPYPERIEIRLERVTQWFESLQRTAKGEDDDY